MKMMYSGVNDLCRLLKCASHGESHASLMLHSGYPALGGGAEITREFLEANRGRKIFVEYPASVYGLEFGEPEKTVFERTVVASDELGTPGTILVQHGCWFRRVKNNVKPLLVSAKVAGYRHAVYGIPENAVPLLFVHPDYPDVMIAATGFSNFYRARYAPVADWRRIWNYILGWLGSGQTLPEWEMAVHPAFAPGDALPAQAELDAFAKSVDWFSTNALALHTELLVGEGYDSVVDSAGRQKPRTKTRGDCTGETALVFACDWTLNRNPASRDTCGRIMDHLFNSPELCCLDPQNPCYGMLNFYENLPTFYGDDSCRAVMGCLASAELLNDSGWDRKILRCLLSCLRTTGPQGFRIVNLQWPASFKNGVSWDHYHRSECYNYRPHSQAWMWAAYLLAWRLSGHREFLDSAREGIHRLMAGYPGNIRWTNGFSQEIARMLLPLALLVRAEDTPEHRAMFERIWHDAENLLMDCGAMREIMGDIKNGMYPSPRNNEEYGTTEAALIQENGDPCCDLLYTVNFAFAGLHEASFAFDNPAYRRAADKMAGFLVRVQAVSTQQPYLNGAWLRGFDWELWDYWGSSADSGWGAWSVETGWTNSWIASTFALRKLNKGLFDLVTPLRYRDILPELLKEMSVVHPLPGHATIPAVQAPGVL